METNGKVFRLDKLSMDMARLLLMLLIPVYRIKKYYRGDKSEIKQIKGGALLASNHTGFSEPMILETAFWYRRVHYIVGEIAMEGKIKRAFMEAAGCIKIDRNYADLGAIKKCVKVLKEGGYLEIFPHGGISDEEAHFKQGAILIAQQADVPVIPIYIMHRKHWWQRYKIVLGRPYYWKEHCEKKIPSVKDIERMTMELEEEYRRCKAFAKEELDVKNGH